MEVFFTSPWVPAEWIQAHGVEPRGVWFAVEPPPVAVAEGVCAFAQSLAALAQRHPEAAVVFTTACDQMRRAADAIFAASVPPCNGSRRFLFNLPATWQTPAARRLYHAEVMRLGRFLEQLGGHAPAPTQLATAMLEHDERRAHLRAFLARASAKAAAEALAQFFDTGSARATDPGQTGRPRDALPVASSESVPLALVGGPLLPAQWPLLDLIESLGGRVVLNATEPGERCLLPPLPAILPGQNALTRLADHYFDHCVDVFHRPNSRLYAWLKPRLADRRVRGIVLWVHVGCDLWRAEAASLREAFGLPVLLLEAHDAQSGSPRDLNRLAAFIESRQITVQPFVAPATKGCTTHSGSVVSKPGP